jgi:hypothetical protein
MKIRTGFVSNSSTTSFCIYGIAIENKNKLKDAWEKLFPDNPFTDNDMYDMCESISDKLKLVTHVGQEVYNHYIGKDWTSIPDDVTPREFKKEITDKLQSVFGANIKCAIHEEAYRDG